MQKDFIGSLLSGLCLCHCLLPPLLLTLGLVGIADVFEGKEWLHAALILPILVVASWSFYPTVVKQSYKAPAYFGIPGFLMLSMALVVEHEYELPLTLLGGALMIIAHWKNYHYIQREAHHD